MRILYAFDRPLPASETDSEQAVNTIAALSRHGVDLTLALPALGRHKANTTESLCQHYQVEGTFSVENLSAPFSRLQNARKFWHAHQTVRLASRQNIDLLYTRNIPTFFRAIRAGLPTVYETYRPWPDQYAFFRPLFRKAMRQPNFVGAVFHSQYARSCYKKLGVDPERLEVVYNGYEPKRFSPNLSRQEARTQLDLPVDAKIVTYTGHVNLTKGLDKVIAIAKRLPETLFLLVGSEGNGVIEGLASRHKNVRTIPWQPFNKTVAYLQAADALILPPSHVPLKLIGNTVLPMKLFLYLAAKRPILAPDAPDVRELLTHEQNALLTAPGKIEEAGQALSRLLGDNDLWDRLAKNAHATASGLTWDARAENIVGFLERRL